MIWKDLRRPAAADLAVDRPKAELLVVAAGGTSFQPGRCFPLPKDATIGRAPSNTIILPDSFVSTKHAKLAYRDGKWWLADLGSRNGVWLNGERIEKEMQVRPDDLLTIGQVELKLVDRESKKG